MLFYSVLLLLITEISSEKCVLDDGTREPSREWVLQKDLLNNNDLTQAPSNSTTILLKFILKSFFFDDQETVFSIFSWVFLSWTDDRLKWDPEKYGGLTETLIEAYYIWMPRLRPQNSLEFSEFDAVETTMECHVKSSGHVTCLGRLLVDTACSNNLTRWPFDTQSCTFKFGAKKNYKNPVIFTFNGTRGVSMFAAEYGPGWNIIEFEKGEDPVSENQFYLTFVVERQGVGLAAVTIVPAFVLAVLTISSMFLEGNTRLSIMLLSLVGHFFFLKEINELIPRHGATTPAILRFVSGSAIFTIITLVTSILLNFLPKSKVAPVKMVIAINDFIKKTPMNLLILRNENSQSVEDENSEVWSYFVSVINTVSIIVATIVYLSVYIAYVPRELPIDYESL